MIFYRLFFSLLPQAMWPICTWNRKCKFWCTVKLR